MSIWDDIAPQAGVNIYAGLSPEQALNKWYQRRNDVAAKYGYTPEQLQRGGIDVAGMAPEDRQAFSMEQLTQQNPDAFRLLQTGKDRVKQSGTDTRQIFNPTTGQWQTQEVKGLWSHPETWGQLIAGGLMGGVVAPAAIASGAPAATVPAAAAPAAAGGIPAAAAGGAPAAATAATAGGAGGSTLGTLGRLAPYLIAGGTDLAGGILGSRAANNAAQQQMAYGEKAMNAMKDAYGQELGFYGQQRDVYSPYNTIGHSALSNLAALTGMPNPNMGIATSSAPYNQSSDMIRKMTDMPESGTINGSAHGMAPGSGQQVVRLRAPDGSEQAVPFSDVQHYLSRGARMV